MKAEIIAVGSELLTPYRTDTNSLYLTGKLNEVGIEVQLKTLVGDDEQQLEQVVRQALERSDLILSSGGLGPTRDDLTKEVFARVLGMDLVLDENVLEKIRNRFLRRGMKVPASNRKQALVPAGAEVLDNPVGTAPGLWIQHQGRIVVLLPGPPRELQPLFEREVSKRLQAAAGKGEILRTRVLHVTGLTESAVEDLIGPIYEKYRNPRVTILASPGLIEVHLIATGSVPEEVEERLQELQGKLKPALGDHLFSDSGEALEEVVGRLLVERGATLALAESCTGGLIAERVTRVPGSSRYFLGGAVCYSNESKQALLGVPEEILRQHGAVSGPVAEAMAQGARQAYGAHYAVSVTGIAGPTGGTADKPVGLVFVGFGSPGQADHQRCQFVGDRALVRLWAAQAALDLLRRKLIKDKPQT